MDFCVSMSVYEKDNPHYFEIALESVFKQTLKPTEVVLIVDGPIPETTSRIIEKMQIRYSNFKVFHLPENLGQGESRRIGLEKCSSELIAIMDSDDICVSDRFEKQINIFKEDTGLSVLGGYIWEFEGEVNNIIGIRKVPLGDRDIKQYLKSRCPFNLVTVMFRKSHVENAGGFLNWHYEEDYYLWIRMLLAGCKFNNLAENLVFVRMNDDSYKRRGGLRYFKSEAALQRYMYDKQVISFSRFVINISIRSLVQLLLPNTLRKWFFKKVFRVHQ